jgi:small ligand-binding sensory domain FIST
VLPHPAFGHLLPEGEGFALGQLALQRCAKGVDTRHTSEQAADVPDGSALASGAAEPSTIVTRSAMTAQPLRDALRFASALSTDPDGRRAAREACREATAALDAPADLAVAFVSHQYGSDLAPLAAELYQACGARYLLGCTAETVIGRQIEVEDRPAISVWLAHLPGVSVIPLELEFERTPEGGTFVGWPEGLPPTWPAGSAVIALAEPFSFPADVWLSRLAEDQPGVPVMGGMASGGHEPGTNRVLLNDRWLDSGAVAVLLHGSLEVRSLVSQGCRPIGRPMVVTKAERQIILELGGKPALAQLQALFDELPTEDQLLVQQGLHVGRVINEYQEQFGRGDFLVRNCIGADRATGAIAVGDFFRTGQTVQFHVRDAATADEDLRVMLASLADSDRPPPAGALLFSCNGRGSRLFDQPHHDATAVAEALGDTLPLAGFFAQGELGPVGGKNFVHGYTASLALFSPKPSN